MSKNHDVNYRNDMAIQDYAKQTRKFLREAEVKVSSLEALVLTLKSQVELQQTQLATLQIKLLGTGPTE